MIMEKKREVMKEKTGDGDEILTEKTTTGSGSAPEEKREAKQEKSIFQGRYLVYYVVGVIEVLLSFRLVFKILGANPESGFVSFIYAVTGIFLAPFYGIFQTFTTQGAETTSFLEPATLIAMAVYGIIGWGIAKLIEVLLVGKR
jgi:hypothetical protein